MIIAISGKIGSGKDTVGKIINYLTAKKNNPNITYLDYCEALDLSDKYLGIFEIKKFAGKLKQIVSILTGIPVGDLEKQEVKDRVLGEEWKVFEYEDDDGKIKVRLGNDLIFDNLAEAWTVRKLLQKIGTDAMRDVIHPNIWVNALFADYKEIIDGDFIPEVNLGLPNWIITDCRFPNELEAVKNRNGISIRVNRYIKIEPGDVIESLFGNYETVETIEEAVDSEPDNYRLLINGFIWNYRDIVRVNNIVISTHPSETALDSAKFDYAIDNNGTIEELIEKVKQILIKENII